MIRYGDRPRKTKEFVQRHYRGPMGEMPEFRAHDPNPQNQRGRNEASPKPYRKGREYD